MVGLCRGLRETWLATYITRNTHDSICVGVSPCLIPFVRFPAYIESFEYSAVTTPKKHNQSHEMLLVDIESICFLNCKKQGVNCKHFVKRCVIF